MAFSATAITAVSIMGGNFGTLPAYETDLFGIKYLDAIHGKFLLSVTMACALGPSIVLYMRDRSDTAAIQDLIKVRKEINPYELRQEKPKRNLPARIICTSEL